MTTRILPHLRLPIGSPTTTGLKRSSLRGHDCGSWIGGDRPRHLAFRAYSYEVARRNPFRSLSSLWSVAATTTNHVTTRARRLSSSGFDETPLGQNGRALLNGLDVYSVPSCDDGHPLAVYGINSTNPTQHSSLHPILLLHGRTWSSVPVYHLLGGAAAGGAGPEQSRSFLEFLSQHGLQPYAMDFRGFGGTPYDARGYVEPLQCVNDTASVLRWIAQRHHHDKISLLGWSQGALIAQLLAQKSPQLVHRLILYGSIYDPLVRYPREPLYRLDDHHTNNKKPNTFDDAIEDFTIEGTILPETAREFARAALITDPVKAHWKHVYQFNNCDPARISSKVLVVAGDQDPYAPLHVQQELFCHLGRGADRTWSILADADHAVHLLEGGRERLTNILVNFVMN
jgi:pimeloyl-ACP methyl ester carboxylesterase